jgi:A/G-specific adenine glycosylase
VVRLLSRFFNIEEPFDSQAGKRIFRELASRHLDRNDPGTYNQAIMEFGARQCKPGIPDCNECPLRNECQAFALGTIDKLPAKKKPVNVKVRNFNYLISNRDKNFIRQRIEKDIWQNLYEFPLIETTEKLSDLKLMEELNSEVSLAATYTHKLSHREINACFWIVKDLQIEYLSKKKNYIKVDHEELHSYPVSRLMEKFIKEKMTIK